MWFVDWLYGRNIPGGDYSYKSAHLITVALVVVVTLMLIYIARNKKISDKTKNIVLKSIAIFQLTFEVVWRIVFACRGDYFMKMWPFYPCNLAGIIIPIAVLCNSKILKKMFYVFGMVGGIITFAMPQGIFNHYYVTFPILKGILQHTGLIYIPAFELAMGTFKIKLHDFGYMFLGLIVHLLNSELLGWACGYPVPNGDYMYFRSGLPFVIPGVPGYVTMSAFGLIVLTLIYVLSDIKTVILFFKSKKHKNITNETLNEYKENKGENKKDENSSNLEITKEDIENFFEENVDVNNNLNSNENLSDNNKKEN